MTLPATAPPSVNAVSARQRNAFDSLLLHYGRFGTVSIVRGIVARYFSVTEAELDSVTRTPNKVIARHTAMALVREVTSASYPEIAAWFGGRDHTTVMAGTRRIDALIATSERFAKTFAALRYRVAAYREQRGRAA